MEASGRTDHDNCLPVSCQIHTTNLHCQGSKTNGLSCPLRLRQHPRLLEKDPDPKLLAFQDKPGGTGNPEGCGHPKSLEKITFD